MIKNKDLLKRLEILENVSIQLNNALVNYANRLDNLESERIKIIEEAIRQITAIIEYLFKNRTEIAVDGSIDEFTVILDKFFTKSKEKSKKCENEQRRGRGRPLGSKNKNKKEGE